MTWCIDIDMSKYYKGPYRYYKSVNDLGSIILRLFVLTALDDVGYNADPTPHHGALCVCCG